MGEGNNRGKKELVTVFCVRLQLFNLPNQNSRLTGVLYILTGVEIMGKLNRPVQSQRLLHKRSRY